MVEEATLDNLGEAQWGEEDEIDIDMGDDLMAGEGEKGDADPFIDGTGIESDIFVPPSAGPDPLQQALKKNPQNVGLHVAAGEFSKALELLRKQLAINDFTSLKSAFVDIHTLSKMKFQSVPHTDAMTYQMRFVDQPLVSITLATL